MKVLTILIPVYNTERYLERCLDSILVDDVRNDLEVLIVNDGSQDGSADIIKKYASKYPDVITFVDKENGGHGSTINVGIKNAKGKYFKVLDSDDWFDTIAFISYLKKLKKCNDDVVLTPYYEEYVYDGNRKFFGYLDYEYNKTYKFNNFKVDSPNYFAFVMASLTYKTSILRESNFQLFEKTYYVDMQFIVFPTAKIKTMRFMEENVYRYFIGRPTQSMSKENLIKHLPDHDKVLKSLISYYVNIKTSLSVNQRKYIVKIIATMLYTHVNIVCFQLKDKRQAFRRIKALDKHLKKNDSILYVEFKKNPYIKYSSKIGYINVLLFNRFFIHLLNLAQKIKRRLVK